MIKAYYKFEILPDNIKASNRIKVGAKIPRYDCTEYSGNCEGIKPFINPRGILKLSLRECKDFIKTDKRRIAEFALIGIKNLNFSSLFNVDGSQVYYGYPNGKKLLKDGRNNPLFKFRNDLYLFMIDEEFNQIELLVLPGQKGFAIELAQSLIDGDFDSEIKDFQNNKETFFYYGCI